MWLTATEISRAVPYPINMKKIYIIIILAAVILIGVEVFTLMNTKSVRPEDPLKVLWAGNYTKEREGWWRNINKYGTSKAYEMFKADAEGRAAGVQHTFAHIFGELIYKKEGMDGIKLCDATFSYGCYHSLAGKAIIEHGLTAIKDLDEVCFAAKDASPLGCLHGIGHGILGYVGYGRLNDALEACEETSWHGPLGGCPGGVFMEYNFHTMESVEGTKARKPEGKSVYEPCSSLPVRFKQECFYNQAQWWIDLYSREYSKVGKLCDAISSELEREACLRGLGDGIFGRTGHDPAAAVAACKTMDSSRSELLCRQGAYRVVFADIKTRPEASRLCEGLLGESLKLCSTEFNLQ